MRRFAGDHLNPKKNNSLIQDKPVVPGFNTEDLVPTPEITPTYHYGPGQDLELDQYIRNNPGSGVALLPGGEQGPAQGLNIPIKNYGGKYMPDATQPTGYRPTPGGLV